MKASRVLTSIFTFVLIAGVAAGAVYWWQSQQEKLPDELVSSNGRIEADLVDISARSAGRLRGMLVREGDLVSAGQILAQLDITELQALRAKYVADQTAQEASMLEAKAIVAQRQADLTLKEANWRRALVLVDKGFASRQMIDQAQSERDSARAALEAAEKKVTAVQRSAQAAKASVDQVDAQIADATLRSPVKGRVLYRLVNPGEVVSAGGKALTVVDLSEIYLEMYLPAELAMRVPIGSQARIQLDGADFAVPARVSFVSPEAQFTPKQVETRSEREKLMFRVKLRIPPNIVAQHIEQAKTGIRGTGYVWLGSNPPEWPEFLQKRFAGDPIDAGE